MLSLTGQVEVGVLRNRLSTLSYDNGNCSWRLTTTTVGVVQDRELIVGPKLRLQETDVRQLNFKCVVDEKLELHTLITVYGETTATPEMPAIIVL